MPICSANTYGFRRKQAFPLKCLPQPSCPIFMPNLPDKLDWRFGADIRIVQAMEGDTAFICSAARGANAARCRRYDWLLVTVAKIGKVDIATT